MYTGALGADELHKLRVTHCMSQHMFEAGRGKAEVRQERSFHNMVFDSFVVAKFAHWSYLVTTHNPTRVISVVR